MAAAGCVLALLLCVIAGAVATGTLGGGAGSGSAAAAGEQAGLSAYQGLPLAFVANGGQTDERVRYYAQAGGSSFFFTATEAVASLTKGERGHALRLRFLGANPEPRSSAPGRGREGSTTWSAPTRHAHEPADLRRARLPRPVAGDRHGLRGREGTLKYEFRVRPGADPSRIRLAYRGQRRLSLGQGGELLIETPLGTLRDSRPVSYQRRRQALPVASRYALGNGGAYGFALGAYDPR